MKVLVEVAFHLKFHKLILIGHMIEGFIEANEWHAAEHAINKVSTMLKDAKKWGEEKINKMITDIKGKTAPTSSGKRGGIQFSLSKLDAFFKHEAFVTFSLPNAAWKSSEANFYRELISADEMFQELTIPEAIQTSAIDLI